MTGLEPATSWSLTRCATNCATSRKRSFSEPDRKDNQNILISSDPGRKKRLLSEFLVSVSSGVAEFDLNLHETVVLGDTVGTAEGTGLDLAAVGSDSDVSDSGVLSFAGTVACYGCVAVTVCHLDSVEGLGKGTNLVDLDEN